MKVYKSQKEFEAEIKDGRFYSEESIDITSFNLNVEANIEVAGNIKAWDIKAWDINAGNIKARDINYYAVAFAYKNIKAKSIKGRRENSRHFVLDGKLEVKEE